MLRRLVLSMLAAITALLFTTAAPAAAQNSPLHDVCDQLGFACGAVVGIGDAHRIGDVLGHNPGSVVDPADVERLTALADQRAAAPATSGWTVWDELAQCESSGRWHINTGNGFTGGLQFHPATWDGFGGERYAPEAYLATREQQIAIAERVLDVQGWGAWPACSRELGLR